MGENEDDVIDIGGKRLRLPAGVWDQAPRALNFALGRSPEGTGDVYLFFLTDEPTVEEIASGGQERVSKLGVRMTVGRFEQFVAWGQEQVDMIRGCG